MFRPTLNYFEHLNCAVHSTNPPPRLHTDWETGRVRRWWTELQTLQLRPIRSLSRFKMPTRFARAHSALSRPRAHFNGVLLLRFFFCFFFDGDFLRKSERGAFQLVELKSTEHKASTLVDFFASPRAELRTFFPPSLQTGHPTMRRFGVSAAAACVRTREDGFLWTVETSAVSGSVHEVDKPPRLRLLHCSEAENSAAVSDDVHNWFMWVFVNVGVCESS